MASTCVGAAQRLEDEAEVLRFLLGPLPTSADPNRHFDTSIGVAGPADLVQDIEVALADEFGQGLRERLAQQLIGMAPADPAQVWLVHQLDDVLLTL